MLNGTISPAASPFTAVDISALMNLNLAPGYNRPQVGYILPLITRRANQDMHHTLLYPVLLLCFRKTAVILLNKGNRKLKLTKNNMCTLTRPLMQK